MNPDPIEALIYQAAETNTEVAYQAVFAAATGREFFLRIAFNNPENPRQPSMSTAMIGDQTYVQVYTSRTHPTVKASPGGIQWEEALRMTLRAPHLSGLMLQGATSWIALDRNKVLFVLGSSQST